MKLSCIGARCNKKNNCALYTLNIEGEATKVVDYSTQQNAFWSPNAVMSIVPECGEEGGYKHYQPIVPEVNVKTVETDKEEVKQDPEQVVIEIDKYKLDTLLNQLSEETRKKLINAFKDKVRGEIKKLNNESKQ